MRSDLSHRERFLRVFEYKDVDRVPNYEFGCWGDTIRRWHKEGLPPSLTTNAEIERYLGLEGFDCLEYIPVNTGLCPHPKIEILECREDGKIVARDELEGIYEMRADIESFAKCIRYPLSTRDDWRERFKPRLDPESPRRFPPSPESRIARNELSARSHLYFDTFLQAPILYPNKTLFWEDLVEAYKARDYPLGIFVGSLYGWIRDWMGVERLSIAFYKDPDWVAEMMDDLINLWIKILQKVLRDIKPDYSHWWEDMAMNTGPLLSPTLFEEFMVPRYRQIINLLEEHGVKIHIVDCDGNVNKLIPGWLKAGINCILPVEARCNNAVELREKFGRKLLMIGCVDKFAVMKGEKYIEAEFRRLTPLLEEGGFIPMMDHRCPPEISYKNYLKYLNLKKNWIASIRR
jgi:uroporphyrinogen decarboxylase